VPQGSHAPKSVTKPVPQVFRQRHYPHGRAGADDAYLRLFSDGGDQNLDMLTPQNAPVWS
jgi:hypothetical protein